MKSRCRQSETRAETGVEGVSVTMGRSLDAVIGTCQSHLPYAVRVTHPAPGARTRRAATEAEAAALSSGLRLRILRMTYEQPKTNKEIAEALGRDPATTLYHVRKLVDTGFLVAQPVRRGTRGAREIPYLSTGLSWSLDPAPGENPAVLGEAMFEAFLGEEADVGLERLQQIRLALRLDEAQLRELRDRMGALLNEFAARPSVPGADLHGVYLAVYRDTDGSAE
jgi:DNA-binding transcriptional ArsR family regulator